ncbi:MAG: TetR/AcrR family transcriptional regulator [Solirubrobacterales bacterium]
MDRDRAILDAASRLFVERGFDAVSVDEIGAAAGVTGPAIYRHFRGKDEILTTLFDEAMDRLLQLAGPPDDDPWVELKHLIRAQVRFVANHRELVAVYAREDRSLDGDTRKRLHRRQRSHVERWVEVLHRCFPDRSEPELAISAHAAIGLLLSVAHWPRDVSSAENLPELLEQLVLHGLDGAGGGDDS